MTAEQQGSDESGEGLATWQERADYLAERLASVQVDAEDRLADVEEEAHGTAIIDLADATDRAESAEAALATARRDADELRGRLAEAWDEGYAAASDSPTFDASNPYRTAEPWMNDDPATRAALLRVYEDLTAEAALANPSAAQGEGEVGARALREAADQTETLRLMVRASALVVMAEVGETDKALATAIGSQAGPALTRWLRARADSLATDADGSGQT